MCIICDNAREQMQEDVEEDFEMNRNRNKHHRRPRALGGGNGKNVVRVFEDEHQAFHFLFSWKARGHIIRPMRPDEICHVLNTTWCDPDWEFQVRRKR